MSLIQWGTGAAHFCNAPSLANVGYRAAWMHDGRLGTNLNDVAREKITETYLMNMDMRIMHERMMQDFKYVQMFAAVGMTEPSNGGTRNALVDCTKPSCHAVPQVIPAR
ncbi:tryptophan tryptophylquinone biosynthesis enzyme MauG [Phaeobacter sp. CECT 5382]|uniref:cytochrome c peroxidase n=1 Tax=Phaeobacter sp. CECT 5382 TaxID=1712645 RepID=UPI0006DAC724|nr:cytochrome c peroxidase [Phaeobacter sp. CECT 5382]CUH88307.1 tryptophan tryptophylquinone biosynthesis enzyme MauG [Phaeobacter sp. CECT 5382]